MSNLLPQSYNKKFTFVYYDTASSTNVTVTSNLPNEYNHHYSPRVAAIIEYYLNPNITMSSDFTTFSDEATDLPLKYQCVDILQGDEEIGRIGSTPIQFYYDLAYDTSVYDSLDDAVVVLESNLVQQIATYYRILPDGVACYDVPLDKPLWIVGVDSQVQDEANVDLDRDSQCQELTEYPTGYECTFMTGSMTFNIVGPPETTDLVEFVREQFNTQEVTHGSKTGLQAKFVATQIDTTALGAGSGFKDELAIGINSVQDEITAPPEEEITIEGGFFVAGLVVVSALFAGVMFRRYRKRRTTALAKEVDAIIEAEYENGPQGQHDRTFELDRSIDGQSHDASSADDLGVGRYDIEEDEDMVILPTKRQYSFELGGLMKNELLGVHGDTQIRASGVTASDAEAEADSDADSWAQTEGSIGSIELHLEPITAEV